MDKNNEARDKIIEQALLSRGGIEAILKVAFKDDDYNFSGINYNKLIKFPEGRLEAFEKWYGRDAEAGIDHDTAKAAFMAGWNALKNLLEKE